VKKDLKSHICYNNNNLKTKTYAIESETNYYTIIVRELKSTIHKKDALILDHLKIYTTLVVTIINNTPSKLTAAAPRMRTNPPHIRCYDTRREVPPCAHAQSWPPLLGAGIAECAVPSRYKMKNRLNHAVS